MFSTCRGTSCLPYRTLNIVVESAVLVAVHLEEPEGVVLPEVLELDQAVLTEPQHYSLQVFNILCY